MTTDSSFQFREATPDDAAKVSELIGTTWATFFAYSVTPADLEHYLAHTVSKAQIKREIENTEKLFLLAVKPSLSSEGIVGVAQLNLDTSDSSLTTARPVELNRLYIDSSLQGSGLAQALLRHTEEHCRRLGRNGLWLGVWEDNARGIRFYEKMGFERRGEHWFWVGESRRRDWIMEKAL